MTTPSTPSVSARFTPTVPTGQAGIRHAAKAEWTKFITVRSTPWTLVITAVIVVGLGMLASNNISNGEIIDDPLRRVMIGFNFGQFAVGVLGVLVITSEFSTKLIKATLAAMPRRATVLGAKALVVGLATMVLGEVLAFVTFALGAAMLSGTGNTLRLSNPGVLRALIESGVYLMLLALIGLGIGAIMRVTAGAIAVFVAVVLILPIVLEAFPTSIIDAISRYLPLNIGVSVFSAQDPRQFSGTPVFSPTVGLIVLLAYATILLGVGGFLLQRRDV